MDVPGPGEDGVHAAQIRNPLGHLYTDRKIPIVISEISEVHVSAVLGPFPSTYHFTSILPLFSFHHHLSSPLTPLRQATPVVHPHWELPGPAGLRRSWLASSASTSQHLHQGVSLFFEEAFKDQVFSHSTRSKDNFMAHTKHKTQNGKRRRVQSSSSESNGDDLDWKGKEETQVANMERGGDLLQRRATRKQKATTAGTSCVGVSSSAQPEVQEEIPTTGRESREKGALIGPLFVHLPARSAQHVRNPTDWNVKLKKVQLIREENPKNGHRSATDPRFWTLFQQDFYETVIMNKSKKTIKM